MLEGLSGFRDIIVIKGRRQKPVSCKITVAPTCFVVSKASLFHSVMMGFLQNLFEKNS